MTNLEKRLLKALREVLPYAESRIEDMEDAQDDGATLEDRIESRELYRTALTRFSEAMAVADHAEASAALRDMAGGVIAR